MYGQNYYPSLYLSQYALTTLIYPKFEKVLIIGCWTGAPPFPSLSGGDLPTSGTLLGTTRRSGSGRQVGAVRGSEPS